MLLLPVMLLSTLFRFLFLIFDRFLDRRVIEAIVETDKFLSLLGAGRRDAEERSEKKNFHAEFISEGTTSRLWNTIQTERKEEEIREVYYYLSAFRFHFISFRLFFHV